MRRTAELAAVAIACSALAACTGTAGGRAADAPVRGPGTAREARAVHDLDTTPAARRGATSGGEVPRAEPAPLRWVLVGDSVAYSLLPTLEAAVGDAAAGLGRAPDAGPGVVGPGLGLGADLPGRNDLGPAPPPETFATWRAQVERALRAHRPQLVVVLLGVWDTIDRQVDGAWRGPGDPAWAQWYGTEVDGALRLAGQGGARVAWVLMPCTGTPRTNERLAHVNTAIREAARRAPGPVATIDLGTAVCDAGVPVTTTRGGVPLRKGDGVHFDPDGAQRVLRTWLAGRLRAALVPHGPPRLDR
jgi:hypothetical protein